MKHNSIVPDASSKLSKKEQVAEMFDNIAGKYDFLNHVLSMGIDKGWRRKAIRSIHDIDPRKILDVATGTGDLAIAAAVDLPRSHVSGIDIAAQMLEVGKVKIAEQSLSDRIEMKVADCENLPYDDHHFDAVLCAYGTRNFQDLHKGLIEMNRVMRPGGKLAILEFSRPKAFPVKQLFSFYFKYILPLLGKMVSRHATAYTYLPDSVMAFPEGTDFCNILEQCGFKNAKAIPLTFGISSLYIANK
jgi:demethylmenaquinone methyltransferase/2-methoxy-6-polyprenyl-1,4-benzoquinol methylase